MMDAFDAFVRPYRARAILLLAGISDLPDEISYKDFLRPEPASAAGAQVFRIPRAIPWVVHRRIC